MDYLDGARLELRRDPRHLLSSARSILCLGVSYNSPGPARSSVSRYAWGAWDYHDVLRVRLRALVADLQTLWGPFEWKLCVDTSPLLERSYARQAGLGWIGRNTCLINQFEGSWLFLAEILISLELPPDAAPPDRCGTCRRCIDACPTRALVPVATPSETTRDVSQTAAVSCHPERHASAEPHEGGKKQALSPFAVRPGPRYRLDARRCISTWTIEQRGALPPADRAASGFHLFGCDICQQVCPWNRQAPLTSEAAFQPVHANPDLVELSALSEAEFRARFRSSALYRTRHAGLQRNAATVMGNSADPRYLPALRRLAASGDAAVAEHARWARARLEAPEC